MDYFQLMGIEGIGEVSNIPQGPQGRDGLDTGFLGFHNKKLENFRYLTLVRGRILRIKDDKIKKKELIACTHVRCVEDAEMIFRKKNARMLMG